jgi:hypothetical protein
MLRIYLNNENEYLDLYENESLELTVSSKDLSDPVKVIGDISKELSVPATKKNNNIFKHYHRGDVSGQLDARKFIQCTLIIANQPNKTGRISLESVSVKSGVPYEYKLRYHSDLAEMIKKLGEDKLSDVDMSAYDDANWDAKDAFENASFTHNQAIVYPLCSIKNRFIFSASNVSAALDLDKTKNIAYNTTIGTGTTSNTIENFSLSPEDVIPALRVGNILDRIETEYDLDFTGAIREDYVEDLRLWLNREIKTQEGDVFTGAASSLTTISGSLAAADGFIGTQSIAFNNPAPDSTQVTISATFSGTGSINMKYDGATVASVTSSGGTSSIYNVTNGGVMTFDAELSQSTTVNLTITINHYDSVNPVNNYTVTLTDSFGTGALGVLDISQRVPDVTVKEFLRTLFEMFNLVSTAETDSTGTVVVNTYHYDYFIYSGNTIDLNKYLDSSDREVLPPNNYSSVTFEATKGDTAIETGYLNTQERKFGYLNYEDDNSDRLSGTDYKVSLKSMFQPLERLQDVTTSAFRDIETATFLDTDNNRKLGKLAFTYATRSSTNTADRLSWRDTTLSAQEAIQNYVVPSNIYTLESVPLRNDSALRNFAVGLHFSEELNVTDPSIDISGISLFNLFYKGTVKNLFNQSFRRTKLDCFLPSNVIADLTPNTKLLIANNYYLISSYTVDYRTQRVSFELLQVGSSIPSEFTLNSDSYSSVSGTGTVIYLDSTGKINYLDVGTGGSTINSIGAVKRTYNIA